MNEKFVPPMTRMLTALSVNAKLLNLEDLSLHSIGNQNDDNGAKYPSKENSTIGELKMPNFRPLFWSKCKVYEFRVWYGDSPLPKNILHLVISFFNLIIYLFTSRPIYDFWSLHAN